VVDELGYYPNIQARALVSGKSKIFGLIVSEITNPFFPEIVQVFENIAVQHQYEILLTPTVHDPKLMESSVLRMIERRVDGVAVMTFGMEELLLEDLKSRQVPLVFVDVGPPFRMSATYALTTYMAFAKQYSTWQHSVMNGSPSSPAP
jgi:LacI family transcriptional regulator